MGTSTAACLPSCTALNTARMATSVLPNPTSPHTRRSIGTGCSMSAFTSTMALSWSGVSWYGKRLLELVLPGRVGRERMAGRGDAPAGRARTSSCAISRTAGAHAALGALPLAAAQAAEGRRLAAGVVPYGVDLVRRHVELVVAAVLEQQVVALDTTDGALDHPAVASDTVLVMDDVVTGLQVLEEPRAVLATARSRSAVGAPATGDVALRQHRQLGARQHEPPLEGRDHDAPAGRRAGHRPRRA